MNITKERIKEDFLYSLMEKRGVCLEEASDFDIYIALASVLKVYISRQWVATNRYYKTQMPKQVYYFSMEFLLGKFLEKHIMYLEIEEECKEMMKEFKIDFERIKAVENDQGLGNGGLGRLAACFLDSMSSINIAGHGCGIRYKYGFFEQKIINGYQVEFPEKWLEKSNIWEIRKPDKAVKVNFWGEIQHKEINGKWKFEHANAETILAVPYDTPMLGYKNGIVNTLRLWEAEPVDDFFDFGSFNKGDYEKASAYRTSVESISKVLYPDDSNESGRLLRLKQEYFFVSAGIQSIIRRMKKSKTDLSKLNERVGIHINDTHPALAVPELMRILMDENGFGWEEAWRITINTLSYTNHTIMSEALEKWPIEMFKSLLPRIYMIVEEINRRFLQDLLNKYPDDNERIDRMSILGNGYVKMAHLAIIGSHSVNGVAKLHTELLKKEELKDFYDYQPYKFNNKTNGITQRRWLMKSNIELTDCLKETIGESFIKHPRDLRRLLAFKNDNILQDKLFEIKQNNKLKLANYIKEKTGILVDTESIFDTQIKRLHEYKRQIMNVLHIMYLYNRLKEDSKFDIVPRTFIFGAKAAPSYHVAKQTIKLINTLADKINHDKTIKDKLKVVFLENYNVSLAERIIPATNVSEQISTATKEASGTSNMKFMLNGAITIATLDGANIEIKSEVGDENIVIFGLSKEEVLDVYREGTYSSRKIYENDARIKMVINQLINGHFDVNPEEFMPIYRSLVDYNDPFLVLLDFDEYIKAQEKINELYKDKTTWQRMSICNIAHAGKFSSDSTIYEYSKGIWDLDPLDV